MKVIRFMFYGILIVDLLCTFVSAETLPDGDASSAPAVAVALPNNPQPISPAVCGDYKVGIDDILMVSVLQPEQIQSEVTVSPDGSISFPYIGNIIIKGLTLNEIRQHIQDQLADGYLKYPLVVVSLKESRSRKFFVYGEVVKPGSYPLEENTTVLRAISMAGGFTRFGSASHLKVLRPKESKAGYDTIQVNIKSVMEGDPEEDLVLKAGDIVVVSEGMF